MGNEGRSAGVVTGFPNGSRIAGYHLEEQIGRGGMAVVFRARDERLQRQVALKVLAPALAADDEFRHRFIRESRAAAAVDDPHIVPVFEAGDADGVLFIAMRYVPGGDVGTLVRRKGPLPVARAAAIISAMAWTRLMPPDWCTVTSNRPTCCLMPGPDDPTTRTCRISG
jgi:serine/threonine protein kinase